MGINVSHVGIKSTNILGHAIREIKADRMYWYTGSEATDNGTNLLSQPPDIITMNENDNKAEYSDVHSTLLQSVNVLTALRTGTVSLWQADKSLCRVIIPQAKQI